MTVRDLFLALDRDPWLHAVGDLKLWQALLGIIALSALGAYIKGVIKGIREDRRASRDGRDETST